MTLPSGVKARQGKPPHILFIMSDQMRHDAVGYLGNTVVKTPNLDRLAASGISFTNAFTPNPMCVPARASLTTGCYPHKCTGRKRNNGAIREGFPLLGKELNRRGYETYAMGKLHYGPYSPPGEPRITHGLKVTELAESGRILSKYDKKNELTGLEDYLDYLHTVGWGGYSRGNGMGNDEVCPAASLIPEEHYVDTWAAERGLHYMRRHMETQPDKPFFMWVSFPKPHSAFDPPRPYDAMYDPRDMPDPIGSMELLQERGLDELFAKIDQYMWSLLSPQAKKAIKAYYYGLISHQDKQIGKLLDYLDEAGLRDDTIVVYTADHGEMLGDFGLYFKSNFYNGSVRVPLIISYLRKLAGGRTSDALVGLQDLMPTMLSLAGHPLEERVDGHDLTSVLLQDRPVRDYYIAQCGETPWQKYMVASREWKYIYHQYGGVEELYNQIDDPHELLNLADRDDPNLRKVQSDMRVCLIRWCLENNDTAMLADGDLVKSERTTDPIKPKTNPFGRRWY